jgi:protein-tyrosine phosphatase
VHHGFVVLWSNQPAGAAIPIFAGPSPGSIDLATPVADLSAGRAQVRYLPFDGRPFFALTPPGGPRFGVAPRYLNLCTTPNFRDLGGYRTRDGRQVAWGRMFRSGQLHDLHPSARRTLQKLPLRLVVDFRSAAERKATPDHLPKKPAPLVANEAIDIAALDPEMLKKAMLRGRVGDMDFAGILMDANRSYVDAFRDRYRAMFSALLEGSIPAVVHCTNGKDRTGIASALILLALGVPEETVMQDYLLTNHYLARQNASRGRLVFFASLFRTPAREIMPLMLADASYLQAGIDEMKRLSGSVDAYLETQLGMGRREREKLRELLLEPAAG